MKRLLLLVLLLAFCWVAKAEITLPHIFSNDMVLQRDTAVLLYGWAAPNEEFSIYTSWNNVTSTVKAGNDAKWEIEVATPNAGGPFVLKFKGRENEIVFDNVLIGEVWLCSGQSNMEWNANSGIDNKEEEIADANYPNIRLFTVQKRTSYYPQDDVSGTWEVCSSETMADFSAVAYFFARKIQKELEIPIGLIDSSWGASCAEVWTPKAVFEKYPELVEAHELVKPNPWVTVERSSLYNAMIAPLTKFKIGGALWYQGESNTANAESYQDLFSQMITSWRNKWQNNFPFYYAQIAPYKYEREFEGGILRDQQRRTLQLENTGMAMTSDICRVEDIHPQNKQDVGLRLANIALKKHFKVLDTEVYGPLFEAVKVNGKEIEIVFSHADGLNVRGKESKDFEILNKDGEWFPAKAKIGKDIVVVSSKDVNHPVAVRYAWKSSAIPDIFNKAGLPASTFTSQN